MKKRSLGSMVIAVSLVSLVTLAWADGLRRFVANPAPARIEVASNGFGPLLPHRIPVPDAMGNPTAQVVEIRSIAGLQDNVRPANPVLPVATWPTTAVLPGGTAGNHFVYATFSARLGIASILSSLSASSANDNLIGTITITAVDPATGSVTPVRGRAFVGGLTFGSVDPVDPSQLVLERWIGLDGAGKPIALDPRGLGFPATEDAFGFAGAGDLVGRDTFVFVVDSDGDLTTHETFPAALQIRMDLRRGVNVGGTKLRHEGLASSTVGADVLSPEVTVAGGLPVIVPGNGDLNVDPATTVRVRFTEPVQPLSLSPGIQLQYGPISGLVDMPFTVAPVSAYDLSHVELTPLYGFPGGGPGGGLGCGLEQVDVVVNAGQIEDLPGNANALGGTTFFVTGPGAGLVNAPVTPDAIYVGRGGSQQSISVIDLNGFGQSTGNPAYDPLNPILEGNSNFPNNPNVFLQGSLLIPPLSVGSCTVDGGSRGVFSLTRDSALDTELVTAPVVQSVGDMALGHPLDLAFNNGSPFGCQAGGGNLCATTALDVVQIADIGTQVPALPPNVPVKTEIGVGNLAAWAPHPNPPPLRFPPICADPFLGQEPTSVETRLPPPDGAGLTNLLVPSSNPLGLPGMNLPPTGLLAQAQNGFFQGPSPAQPTIVTCQPYMMRQQVGQFLYVADRAAGHVVVLNSNRFTVIARIPVVDATSFAMSPNLEFLAVTSYGANRVSFIDTNPGSATFHSVVKTVAVGGAPAGIAWSPDNEDILVCNTADDTVSVISAFSLEVRKTLCSPDLTGPLEVAITARQTNFGLGRNVWFGYVLNADGTVAVFESGPDGINGWGYDAIVGALPFTFANPKTLQPDPLGIQSGFWVVHENQLDPSGAPTGLTGGAATRVSIVGGTTGVLPLDPGQLTNPMIRNVDWGILASIGSDTLTGVPTDLAFDDQNNASALTNASSTFSAGTPLSMNGKSLVKTLSSTPRPGKTPQFLFLAIPSSAEGPGVVDVIDLLGGLSRFDTNPFDVGTQSIEVPGARVVVDYFRQ